MRAGRAGGHVMMESTGVNALKKKKEKETENRRPCDGEEYRGCRGNVCLSRNLMGSFIGMTVGACHVSYEEEHACHVSCMRPEERNGNIHWNDRGYMSRVI